MMYSKSSSTDDGFYEESGGDRLRQGEGKSNKGRQMRDKSLG